jgi:hypothetical protein
MRNTWGSIAHIRQFLVLAIFAVGILPAAAAASGTCTPEADLSFICDADRPEDLARIPRTRWLIASGFSPGSGLKLVDTRSKTQQRWFLALREQVRPNVERYPDCASPPDPTVFSARGISLRMTGRRRGTLHVVNHGGRESIEVFEILIPSKNHPPELAWKGCLLMPTGHVGNAVATFSDGTVLVTVLTRPGKSITDFERGWKTGAVYERLPGASAFSMIPGTELPGNNGLETSRDDQEFYVVAFGLRAVAVFARGQEGGPKDIVKAPGFMPDNIRYDGERFLAAGMISDEPACGGVRQIVNGVADTMLCPRGYRVAELDPRKGSFHLLAEGKRSERFNGVSSAVILGRDIWLGSYQADRLAYRKRYPIQPRR